MRWHERIRLTSGFSVFTGCGHAASVSEVFVCALLCVWGFVMASWTATGANEPLGTQWSIRVAAAETEAKAQKHDGGVTRGLR